MGDLMCFPVPFSESPATQKHLETPRGSSIWALHLPLAAPLARLSACQISFAHCRFLYPISNLTLLVTRIWSSPDLLSTVITVTNFLLSRANNMVTRKTVLRTLSCQHCKAISRTISIPDNPIPLISCIPTSGTLNSLTG